MRDVEHQRSRREQDYQDKKATHSGLLARSLLGAVGSAYTRVYGRPRPMTYIGAYCPKNTASTVETRLSRR